MYLNLISLVILLAIVLLCAKNDIKKTKIPNGPIVCGIFEKLLSSFISYLFFGTGFLPFLNGVAAAFIVLAAFFLVSYSFKKLTGLNAFGGGDIKLLFLVSLHFSLADDIKIIFMALALAASSGIIFKLVCKSSRMPFAPAVFGGLLFHVLFR